MPKQNAKFPQEPAPAKAREERKVVMDPELRDKLVHRCSLSALAGVLSRKQNWKAAIDEELRKIWMHRAADETEKDNTR